MPLGKFLTSVVIICFLLPVLPLSAKTAGASGVDKNLEIEKDYLNRRYDGFYRHSKSYKDYQVIRKKKIFEHKKKRDEHVRKYEKVRKAYKDKKAKIKKQEIDFDALMLKEEKKRAKKRKKMRNVYIKRREIMRHLKRTTKKIPEDLDVGLKRLGEMAPKKK